MFKPAIYTKISLFHDYNNIIYSLKGLPELRANSLLYYESVMVENL